MSDEIIKSDDVMPKVVGAEEAILSAAGMVEEKEVVEKRAPYKVVGDSKIPVSKATGKLWQQRMELGKKAVVDSKKNWEEAANYYANEQYGDERSSIPEDFRNTENVVFSNTTTMLPAIYTKNPEVAFTAQTGFEDQDYLDVLKRLINVLLGKNHLNLKSKVRKCCLWTLLTNEGYLKLEWIEKEFSTEETYNELMEISNKLAVAKDEKEIKELEGQLMAIEATFDVLTASGAKASVKSPHEIIVDPSCQETDMSDCSWMIDLTYLPTAFLRARYMKKDEEGDDYKLIYKPTHTVCAEEGESALGKNKGSIRYSDYVDNKVDDMYDPNNYTQVAFIWDKVTRRVFLYNAQQMTYPIWVWNDPLELTRFFPYFLLQFYPALNGIHGKGEVSYYLDHQDTINIKNAANRKILEWATNRWAYDKNKITNEDVTKLLSGDSKFVANGFDLPEGSKFSDLLSPVLPPIAQHMQLLDKREDFQAIDRLSAVTDALRGAQFTANTTNDAVQLYNDATKLRVGEKTDLLEDMLEDFIRSLCEIVVSKMTSSDVERVLSAEDAKKWKQLSVKEFNSSISVGIAIGSTQKPNSIYKQERAIKIGQVLGQFAQAAPGAIIMIILKMYQEAFDEVNIKQEDWKSIEESIMKMEQAKNSPAQSAGDSSGIAPEMIKELLSFVLKILPPELKSKLNDALQSGANPIEAIVSIAQGAVK